MAQNAGANQGGQEFTPTGTGDSHFHGGGDLQAGEAGSSHTHGVSGTTAVGTQNESGDGAGATPPSTSNTAQASPQNTQSAVPAYRAIPWIIRY